MRDTKASAPRAEPLKLRPRMSVPESLASVLASCSHHVRANLAGASKGREPENIHQLRVGLRRMRAALSVYKPALAPSARHVASEDLKRLEHRLGEAREWDVLIDAMNDSIWAGDLDPRGIEDLLDVAETRRRKARDLSGLALTQADIPVLLQQALRLAKPNLSGQAGHPGGILRPFAVSVLEKRDKKIRKAGRQLSGLDLRELHRLRIRIKKLRYASEFFAAIWPGPATVAYIKRLKGLQQRLGNIQDTVSSCRLVRELGCEQRRLADDARVAAHWLKRERKDARRRLGKSWRKFKRAARYWRSAARQ